MMLLRTNWLFVAFALVLATFLVGVQPAYAQGGNWRVVIMNELSELEAKKKLEEFSPIGDVAVLPNNGKYGLFVGGYATKAEAEVRLAELKGEGWLVVDVLEVGTGASTPPPGTSLVTSTTSTTDAGGFRVMVSTHATAAEAEAKKQELETNHGLFPVDVVQDGNSFRVYVGYPATTKAQAEDNAAALRTEVEGITFTVVDTGAGASTAPTIGISEEERIKLEEIKKKYEDLRQDRITQDEYDREKQKTSAETQKILEEMEARRKKEEAATKYTAEIRQAANRGDFQRADAMLAEWKRMDQANPTIILMEEWLASRKREANAPGGGSAVAELVKQAEDKERQGDMEAAMSIWQSVKATANDDATRRRATNRVSEISEDLSKTKVAPPPLKTEGGSSKNMMYLLIGAAVLVIAGVAVFFVMRSRSRTPAKAAPRPAGTLMPGMPMVGKVGRDSKSSAGMGASSVGPRPPSKDKPSAAPHRDSGDAGKTSRDSKSKPGEPARDPRSAPLAIDNLMGTPAPQNANGAAPPDPVHSSAVRLEGITMPTDEDEFPSEGALGDDPKHDSPAPAARKSSSGSVPVAKAPVPQMPAPPAPPAAPAEPAAAPAAQAPAPATRLLTPLPIVGSGRTPIPIAGNIYFEQNFEDEEVGSLPKNWRGSYDYASLSVIRREDGGSSSKCMKFEKKSGTGSAYFCCRFPDASGRVAVEFDMRCDFKNKYLLGFYVEMDEDFRHSVHTVVHMDATKADKVSLRLQNETAPYKLGDWCRVRYLVDLPRHMVDGFVDDKPIAVGVRLPSRPKVINTLSIRDNLATEGLLLIDNIRIFSYRG